MAPTSSVATTASVPLQAAASAGTVPALAMATRPDCTCASAANACELSLRTSPSWLLSAVVRGTTSPAVMACCLAICTRCSW